MTLPLKYAARKEKQTTHQNNKTIRNLESYYASQVINNLKRVRRVFCRDLASYKS